MKTIQLFEPVIRDESIEAVKRILKSGWIGMGPETESFERNFSRYIGCKYTVGLNSCTSALHLAMKLLGIRYGDEVITTPLTFVSTNHAILYEGGIPVFSDIDPVTLEIDPESVEINITKKTKAILVVHYGGYPVDMDRIRKISIQYNIPVVEDCAHACGAFYQARKIGSLSAINCFSFHAVKNLPMGDGGAVTTDSRIYEQRLKKLRWLGINKDTYSRTENDGVVDGKVYAWKYNVDEIGYKYHMNDIQAAIGNSQLKYLDSDNKRRREIAGMYVSGLHDVKGIRIPKWYDSDFNAVYGIVSAQHLFVILAERREDLITHLKNNGINPGVHYIRNDFFSMYSAKRLLGMEDVQEKLLSLPMHVNLSDDDVKRVVSIIQKGW
jgi:perosamine synthetase